MAQNISMRRNLLQLKELCKSENANLPKWMQMKTHLHKLDNIWTVFRKHKPIGAALTKSAA